VRGYQVHCRFRRGGKQRARSVAYLQNWGTGASVKTGQESNKPWVEQPRRVSVKKRAETPRITLSKLGGGTSSKQRSPKLEGEGLGGEFPTTQLRGRGSTPGNKIINCTKRQGLPRGDMYPQILGLERVLLKRNRK